ncbi:MAG: hypothetical protein R3C49_23760 [Planctomycetaceae bacterium]
MSCGPTGSIIRREIFLQSGGFRKEWGVLSDSDLWYRLAARHSILLLPPGLVWWRRHHGQEYSKEGAAMDYLCRGYELDLLHLSAAECPLPEQKRQAAMSRKRQHMARRLIALAIKERSPLLAMRLKRNIGMPWSEIAGGLRAYQP